MLPFVLFTIMFQPEDPSEFTNLLIKEKKKCKSFEVHRVALTTKVCMYPLGSSPVRWARTSKSSPGRK